MNDQTDQHLLRDYAERHSEAAFAALVHRYVDLVYSAALRMVCDTHAAKDVTQSVFLVLAQNARQLTDRPALAGWLHSTARNVAAKTVRSEVRRRAREQEAAVMNELLSTNPDTKWEYIAPHLDDALGELSEPDRDAVLLRYFKNHDLRTVGATLGISDDAAQKRVSRAVERLREFFAKRGVTVGASGLAVVISANAVQAAPVGLAVTISAAAALTGTTLATTATITTAKAIAMTTLQKTLAAATIAVLAGVGIYEARQASQLRDQVQTLQQEQAPLAKLNQELTQALITATNQVAALRDANERLNQNTGELLRLRSEISHLKIDYAQMTRDSMGNTLADKEIFQVAKSLVDRVNELKTFLAAHPNLQFPESELAHYFQWLMCIPDAMDSEEKFLGARRKLQGYALHNLGGIALLALQDYSKANEGRFPTELSDLRPYFKVPIGDEILNRYKIVDASLIERLKNSVDADGKVIIQKSKADDEPELFIGAHAYYLH